MLALAEDGAADADMGGAQRDGAFEVAAHTHRQARQSVTLGDFGEQGEVQAGLFVDGRDAHQPLNRKVEGATVRDEGVGVTGQDAGLLILFAGVDLDEETGAASLFLGQPRYGFGQLGPIDGLDRIEEVECLPRLVGLKRADEVKDNAIVVFTEAGPFAGRFLYAILAENPVALFQNGGNPVVGLNLGDSNQFDRARAAPGNLFGGCEAGGENARRVWSFGAMRIAALQAL